MDRNSIIGFSLIFLILTGYYWYTSPTDAELKEQARQDSIALVAQKATQAEQNKQVASEQSTTGKTKDSAKLDSTLIGSIGSFAQQVNGDNKEISIGNKEITLGIQTRGAGIGRVTLNNYKRSDSSKLELLEPNSNRWFFELFTSNGPLKSSDFVWKVEAQSASMVRLRLGDSLQHIDLTYRLDPEGFEVYSQLKLVGVDQLIKARNSGVRLEWNAQLHKQERDFKWENQNSTVAYKLVGEDPDKLSEASEGEEVLKNRVQWVAFKQQYFSSVMLAKDGFSTDAKLGWTAIPENRQLETGKIKAMSAELYLDYEREKEKVYDLSYYFGPNQYYTMQEAKLGGGDHQLQRIIPMGWGIFGWVNRYVVVPVFHALDGIIGSMGIIILLLTVIIKTALLPLVYKSYISTAKMRILKPELDEIKEKHGNDMPFYGDHVSFFTILMTVSTLIYTHLNNQISGVTGQMKYIGYIMPIIFLGVLNDYASGLTWYYFVSNMITFGQQWVIRRTVDDTKLHAQIAENRKKPATKSKFQQRMEEAMKMSQQRAAANAKGKKK